MQIVKDSKYPNLYRVQWPNGDVSVSTPFPDREDGHYGFYNKSRAKEYLRKVVDIENYVLNQTYVIPMGHFY